MVLRACSVPVVAGQMASFFEAIERPANCPLTLSRLLGNGQYSRPALAAFVVRLIGKREQHQLFAGREVNLPYQGHELYAHPNTTTILPCLTGSPMTTDGSKAESFTPIPCAIPSRYALQLARRLSLSRERRSGG